MDAIQSFVTTAAGLVSYTLAVYGLGALTGPLVWSRILKKWLWK